MDTLSTEMDRRSLIKAGVGVGLGTLAGGLLIGCGGSAGLSSTATTASTAGTTSGGSGGTTSTDLFNFALNLEYLEAEYYLRGVTGNGLGDANIGASPGAVTGGRAVGFSSIALRTIAQEFASEEVLHVQTLRAALGSSAVSRPAIDFTNAFNAVGQAAGIGAFDPFADEVSFLLGAFLFEDLGVTAYYGAMASMTSTSDLVSTAGILSAESYHAGAIRTILFEEGGTAQSNAGRLSSFRASLGNGKDQQLASGTLANVSQTDTTTGRAFARTSREILDILYLAANLTQGGFFPSGMNGTIR